jgi:hypothetical protein|tara:strand:- start:180 stop:515 length:336 start_codon:yes stop_codon:yes gene_type:complete
MLQLQKRQARQILIALGYKIESHHAGSYGFINYVTHGAWSKKRNLPLPAHPDFIAVGHQVAAFSGDELCSFCIEVLRSLQLGASSVAEEEHASDELPVGEPDACWLNRLTG